jgi:hypothetical protein
VGLILPFDQAEFYNLVAEVLASEALSLVLRRRTQKRDYAYRVAQSAVAALRDAGLSVDQAELEELIRGSELWTALAEADATSIEQQLSPLLDDQQVLATHMTASALIAGELLTAAINELPADQRLLLLNVQRLRSATQAVFTQLVDVHKDLHERFDRVQALLEIPADPSSASIPSLTLVPSPFTTNAARIALVELLALQWPWGEWSDRRTELESVMAERRHSAVRGMPKPNMARTLFALEAISDFGGARVDQARKHALSWIRVNVENGWFWEWAAGQSEHSETSFPEAVRRADVRHTAQALTAMVRWQKGRDGLVDCCRSLVGAQLGNGYWPNNRNGLHPRVLASVYAIEALAGLAGNDFRLPLGDLMDRPDALALRRALRLGAETLLQACEVGEGLLGAPSAPENPYLTGLALFRLARGTTASAELSQLCTLMASGLLRTASATGWEDSSVPPTLRSRTRIRATLRCAAGLSLAANNGIDVPPDLVQHAISLVEAILLNNMSGMLDSPDFACALIALQSVYPKDLFDDDITSRLGADADARRRPYALIWMSEIENLIESWGAFKALNVPGYQDLSAEYEEHLYQLRRLADFS